MNLRFGRWGAAFLLCAFFTTLGAAESHRATRLGNPATRFADPIVTQDDLRARFRNAKLRSDIAVVTHQWGWKGDLNDLFDAAAIAPISEVQIAVGQVMPFMSSRENGRPICLRNVTWAGDAPTPALAFVFASRGQMYRCVTPKACSNFFLEDLGPEPRHGLGIKCEVPGTTFVGRNVQACFTVHNSGNVMEQEALVSVPVPGNARFFAASEGGLLTNGIVVWRLASLPPDGRKQVCAIFKTAEPGVIAFQSTVTSPNTPPRQSVCETVVAGVSALLLEKADHPDPVSVGETTTYTVRVTNQGTADDTDIDVVVEFPVELDPVSASHGGSVLGKTVRFPPFPKLSPKQAFEYSITARGAQVGDARVTFIRTSVDIPATTSAEESTRVY